MAWSRFYRWRLGSALCLSKLLPFSVGYQQRRQESPSQRYLHKVSNTLQPSLGWGGEDGRSTFPMLQTSANVYAQYCLPFPGET